MIIKVILFYLFKLIIVELDAFLLILGKGQSSRSKKIKKRINFSFGSENQMVFIRDGEMKAFNH